MGGGEILRMLALKYPGIETGQLPKGIEVQAMVDIVVERPPATGLKYVRLHNENMLSFTYSAIVYRGTKVISVVRALRILLQKNCFIPIFRLRPPVRSYPQKYSEPTPSPLRT